MSAPDPTNQPPLSFGESLSGAIDPDADDDAHDWQLDFDWLRVRHFVKASLKHPKLPDLQAVLMLIGVQELGRWRSDFTKEEKQDLMHVGACEVLSASGYWSFTHRDADGWPHYKAVQDVDAEGHVAQELLLKRHIVGYFDAWEEFEGFKIAEPDGVG